MALSEVKGFHRPRVQAVPLKGIQKGGKPIIGVDDHDIDIASCAVVAAEYYGGAPNHCIGQAEFDQGIMEFGDCVI